MKKMLLFFGCLILGQLAALEYEIQLENDQVIVARVKVEPKEELGFHRDAYPQVVIALQGGIITRIESDGRKTDVEFPTGKAVFRSPDPEGDLHKSVNPSSDPIELILVQLKPSQESKTD